VSTRTTGVNRALVQFKKRAGAGAVALLLANVGPAAAPRTSHWIAASFTAGCALALNESARRWRPLHYVRIAKRRHGAAIWCSGLGRRWL
jgi:hypothetical protein